MQNHFHRKTPNALACGRGIQGRAISKSPSGGLETATPCNFSQSEISANNKTFAKQLRTCFDICANSMHLVSILSLRNEFPLRDSAQRFLIGLRSEERRVGKECR